MSSSRSLRPSLLYSAPRLLCAMPVLLGFVAAQPVLAQQEPDGLARPHTAIVPDAVTLLSPAQVQVTGEVLGERYTSSWKNWLLTINENELLDGFRHRPGKQAWVGEHVGKWLHAAALTCAATGDPALRAKMDRVAAELIKTQEADGYLGTYVPGKRFGIYQDADWDVWSHKYNLIGLLTYYQYTGNKAALESCKRIGDLLLATFGPGKKSLLDAGAHMGLAPASIIEPMVLLYRATGDRRFLDFAKYALTTLDLQAGARLFSFLLDGRGVNEMLNKKSYEMTSCLVGMCELYRATGDRRYLTCAMTAWNDIKDNQLDITGSGSRDEYWPDKPPLSVGERDNVDETCVTVTWLQFNMQLYRLTGEARFAEEIEKTLFNHLLAAQEPRHGTDWCYFTPLQGRKPYSAALVCCHSSGPRGIALAPLCLYAVATDGINVNYYAPSTATVPLPGGGTVQISQKTAYPLDGAVSLTLTPKQVTAPFALRLRVPAWTAKMSVALNGKLVEVTAHPGEFLALRRRWQAGDVVRCEIDMTPRSVMLKHSDPRRVALMYGPLVLAADIADNSQPIPASFLYLAPATDDAAKINIRKVVAAGAPVFATDGLALEPGEMQPHPMTLRLRPYYAVGSSFFTVWLKRPATLTAFTTSFFSFSIETRSRGKHFDGALCDTNTATVSVAEGGTVQQEDWFALSLPKAVTISHAAFAHGYNGWHGGWFDSSGGKPRFQVRKTADGPWEEIAAFTDYPQTTASSFGKLREEQRFSLTFSPVKVVAIRVIGRPSWGDQPGQNQSSCGELEAY